MHLKKAINRINTIEWGRLGGIIPPGPYNDNMEYEAHLGYEYLRRMAGFIKEQNLKPSNPLFINIAAVLGDKQETNNLAYCSLEVQYAVKDKSLLKTILNFYLQLANFADSNKNAALYLSIYDPLIQLLEHGLIFSYREAGLMIYNVSYYPLSGWYDRFVEALP